MQGYKVMLQGCNFSMQAIFSQLPLRIFAFCCCTSNYRFHVDLKFKQICKIFYILLGARLSTCHFEYYLGSICFWSPLCTPWINSSSRHALLSSNFLCVISCYYLNIIIRIATCSIVISQGCSDYVFKVKTFVFVAVTRALLTIVLFYVNIQIVIQKDNIVKFYKSSIQIYKHEEVVATDWNWTYIDSIFTGYGRPHHRNEDYTTRKLRKEGVYFAMAAYN